MDGYLQSVPYHSEDRTNLIVESKLTRIYEDEGVGGGGGYQFFRTKCAGGPFLRRTPIFANGGEGNMYYEFGTVSQKALLTRSSLPSFARNGSLTFKRKGTVQKAINLGRRDGGGGGNWFVT